MESPGRYPFAELETGTFFFTTDSGQYYTIEVYSSTSLVDTDTLVKVDFQIPGFDGEEFDISLLIHNNHPQMYKYIDEFRKRLNDNFNKNSDF